MFDMREIGNRISVMRKNAGMTQMELANRLSISYQAVSNWERGLSMPDIANLSELSKILSVSIDDIIKDKNLSALITDDVLPEEITAEEFNAISPLLSAEKNKELIEHVHINNVGAADINTPALGLTQDEMDDLARSAYERGDVAQFGLFSRSISEGCVRELCRKAFDNGNVPMFAILIGKLSEDEQREYLKDAVDRGNLPFVAISMRKLKPKDNDNDDYDDDDDDDYDDDDDDDDDDDE